MGFIEWMEKRIKTLNLWDIAALKTYCLLIGVVVGAYMPAFVKEYLAVIVAVIVLLGIKLVYKVYVKK